MTFRAGLADALAAYPTGVISSIAQATPGTVTKYDALGRPTQVFADSEWGTSNTVVDYLPGFTKRETNPRGFATTTSYQAFDEPSEAAVTSITAPEGVGVNIQRDVFGKPTSITRSGPWGGSGPASVTRSYVYDANQLLCMTLEPEIGATVQVLDAANNVTWRGTGLNLPSASCDAGSVPSNRIVAFTYDPRNRLTGTGFGDGSPAIGRSYTPDGLPATIVSNGSTLGYNYNNRRLMSSEVLDARSISGGWIWGFSHVYDANGHEATLWYPDGASYDYEPNALGEAKRVGGYASGVRYHPNGAVASYTLGNGIAHSFPQNVRGLPAQNIAAGVMNDRYHYDPNGNIDGIADPQEGISTREMAHDGLDRLSVVNAWGLWGSATYGYDGLGNLRTSNIGGRNSAHNYDAQNRLGSINSNGVYTGYVYDLNGNVTGRGAQGYYFDLGNRLQLAHGKASYRYDGLGRRIHTSSSDGTVMLHYYSQSGQLLFQQRQNSASVQNIRHVYLGGKQIAEVDSTYGTSYFHNDLLGSPVAKTNASGAVIARTRYEPYGKTAAGTDPNGIGFTGHVNDADTGLVYMQQRYYDPVAGRFLSTDPVTSDANTGKDFNVYEYAKSNPYRYTDPDGRQSTCSAGLAGCTSYVINGADAAITGGYGVKFNNAMSQGNYLGAAGNLAAGITFGLANVATAGEAGAALSAGRTLAAGQGGRFASLVGTVGDDLTAHHIPQAALGLTTRADGGAIVMTTTEHEATRTFGFKGALTAAEDAGRSFRDVLAKDIRDVRGIVGDRYNQGLRDVLQHYRANFPGLMSKP